MTLRTPRDCNDDPGRASCPEVSRSADDLTSGWLVRMDWLGLNLSVQSGSREWPAPLGHRRDPVVAGSEDASRPEPDPHRRKPLAIRVPFAAYRRDHRARRPTLCFARSGYGASRSLRRIPAIVSFLNPQPTLSLVGGNRSSCPTADLRPAAQLVPKPGGSAAPKRDFDSRARKSRAQRYGRYTRDRSRRSSAKERPTSSSSSRPRTTIF
jgi:hypothetical protein